MTHWTIETGFEIEAWYITAASVAGMVVAAAVVEVAAVVAHPNPTWVMASYTLRACLRAQHQRFFSARLNGRGIGTRTYANAR